jgi:predicted PurR-regulated permease PerM
LFIPLFLGLLIAIILYPVCIWLEHKRLPKTIAIAACILLVAIIFGALSALFVWQLNTFSKDLPAIFAKLAEEVKGIQQWLLSNTGAEINLQQLSAKLFEHFGSALSSALQTTANTLFILFLTPVFTALFLFHRRIFVQYVKMIIPAQFEKDLDLILKETIHTYFNYIKGMVLVYVIVGLLNSAGLFLLGVDHFLLFGMLCAVMTIIPYVGIIVSAMLPISMIWLQTGSLLYPAGVILMFSLVQYLEANIIFPKVVGQQLQVSTMAMLVAIIAGGIIWGVSGMILFIPFVAILKIASDHIQEWKALNTILRRD